MKTRVVILGAGFGGLELSSVLARELGDEVEVTLIDRSEGFSFGFSKLEVMFGRATAEQIRTPYAEIAKPGVRFIQEAVTSIDPEARTAATGAGTHEADFLVVALGADYDLDATPGLAEAGSEFYSVAGAEQLAGLLPEFSGGRVVIGAAAAPIKCPPAPSETALLLDEYLIERGIRDRCEISVVIPFARPVPPSADASRALLAAFAERGIEFVAERAVSSLDLERAVAVLDDGAEMAYELFLGIPKHRAPEVVIASGLAEDGFVPADPRTLETRFPGVYAVGDVASLGIPKAGVFAESAARAVAASVIARVRGGEQPEPYRPRGSCYIEFGAAGVGRVDVEFIDGPPPIDTFHAPSMSVAEDKRRFGASRRERWFGR